MSNYIGSVFAFTRIMRAEWQRRAQRRSAERVPESPKPEPRLDLLRHGPFDGTRKPRG